MENKDMSLYDIVSHAERWYPSFLKDDMTLKYKLYGNLRNQNCNTCVTVLFSTNNYLSFQLKGLRRAIQFTTNVSFTKIFLQISKKDFIACTCIFLFTIKNN